LGQESDFGSAGEIGLFGDQKEMAKLVEFHNSHFMKKVG
jgi:hypothetical protein